MKLIDMRLGDFLSQIGQSKPSISGSTASLIAGRLGGAMIRMALAVSSKHGTNNDLLSRRNGRWGLPKGHVDPDETSQQAAAREAYE
jgi:predicted NUDIX family NTP pyrophosphohydrolase